MNDGAWEIAPGRLCADCVRAMWLEYIFAPRTVYLGTRNLRPLRGAEEADRKAAVHDEQTRAGEKRTGEWA